MQTFYQAFFSTFPLAFSLQQFFSLQQSFPFPFSIFLSTILFPFKSFPYQKAQNKAPKDKSPSFSFRGVFYSNKEDGATGKDMTL
jgi:hypothetical protein